MSKILVHGHRGARGYYPENTIHGFLRAIDMGSHAIEMDVVISADNQVVVSHEPWMHSNICSKPDGSKIDATEEKNYNLYKMLYAEIAEFDCGARGNIRFPEQQPLHSAKPLLEQVIQSVEHYTKSKNMAPVIYNIETKCSIHTEGKFHPPFDLFTQLVYECCAKYDVLHRTIFQSFDERNLVFLNGIDDSLQLSLLSEIPVNIQQITRRIGFTPKYYSCLYTLVDDKLMEECSNLGMDVLCWTVNNEEDIRRMKQLNVSGIITDYPDRVKGIL